MTRYLFWRILQIIPVLFIISFIVFFLVYVAGDPVSLMLPEDATEEDRQVLREALGWINRLSFSTETTCGACYKETSGRLTTTVAMP